MKKLIILACIGMCAVIFGGCTRNSQTAMERTFHPNGSIASELEVKGRTTSTLGSKTEAGAGKFRYVGNSDTGDFEMMTGNDVKGQDAGDGAELLRSIVMLGQIFAPMLEQPTAPELEAPEESTPDLSALANQLFPFLKRLEP